MTIPTQNLQTSMEYATSQNLQTSVEYTISQDFAAGYIAEQEKNLQGFLEKGQEDFTVVGPPTWGYTLQDYSTQLMLLERQNKKRLLMARLEQNGNQEEQVQERELQALDAQQMATTRKRPRVEMSVEQPRSDSAPASKIRRARPNKSGKGGANIQSSDKLSVPNHGSLATAVNQDSVGPKMSDLGRNRKNCGENGDHEDSTLSHSRIVYRINCNSDSPLYHHAALAFEDAPVLRFSRSPTSPTRGQDRTGPPLKNLHADGARPIYNLNSCLTAEDDVAFIILRESYCSECAPSPSQVESSRVWHENIFVKSSALRSALNATACCYIHKGQEIKNADILRHQARGLGNNASLMLEREMYMPHLFLYHHRSRLKEYAANHSDALMHVRALLAYTSETYGENYEEADKLFSKGLVTRQHLNKLFAPNELVFTYTNGQPAAYAIQRWPTINSDGSLELDCWSWKPDGSVFVRKNCTLDVLPPQSDEGTKIQLLSVLPLAYIAPEIRSRLELRGRKHWTLRSQSYVSYKGWNVSHDQFYPDSRFMVDYQTYYKLHPNADAFRFDRAKKYPFDPRPLYLTSNAKCDADLFCLMAPDTHGFYFTEKKWINLSIEDIQPVKWNKCAYDRLVLPFQTKELVRALVMVRTSQRGVMQGLGLAGKREDIISGKGNGLIMLLHGGPGTGKTLTAESVAEIAEMPLYRVTCGDIGTNADAVERYLNNVLYLGKTWNCVLLLDEADVFLEERSMSDLKRNSLVSVFLRILEYYDGILMLTSNRVGTFDEAFKSRIQVALHYEALTRSSRRKIWQNFLDMMREDEENVDFDELRDRLDELAGHDMNGRQIRNSLTTARQLAIYKKEPLTWAHLEQAIRVSADFNQYLERVHGHTDEQWAKEGNIRAP